MRGGGERGGGGGGGQRKPVHIQGVVSKNVYEEEEGWAGRGGVPDCLLSPRTRDAVGGLGLGTLIVFEF